MSPLEIWLSLPYRARIYLVLCGIAGALIAWLGIGFGLAMGGTM